VCGISPHRAGRRSRGGGLVTRPRRGVAHIGLERGASVRHHRLRVLLEGLSAHSLFRASASKRLLTTCDRQCACSVYALTLPAVLIVVAPRQSHCRRADGTWPATRHVPTIPATALALCIPVLFLCLTNLVLLGSCPHRCLRGVRTAMARVQRTRADVDGDPCFAVCVCSSLSGEHCVSTTCLTCEPGGVGVRVLSLCVAPPTFPRMKEFSSAYGH